MLIKKDQVFTVRSKRKGVFKAIAIKDFDTDIDKFYPIATLETVRGITQVWKPGDVIPCNSKLCKIVV